MAIKNEPAFPIPRELDSYDSSAETFQYESTPMSFGLTKREYFAAKALQGLCSNSFAGHLNSRAETAVLLADALILELEKKENT